MRKLFLFSVLLLSAFFLMPGTVHAQDFIQPPVGACSGNTCTAPTGGSVWRFECDGRAIEDFPECRSNGQNVGSSASFGGGSCNKTVQYDVFEAGKGPGDPTIGLVVYYTGDCPGGSNPPTTSGPQCKGMAGFVGNPALTNGENEARAPRLDEDMYLVCRKVQNASSYRFRVFYTRNRPPYEFLNATDGVMFKLKRFASSGEKINRSVAFKADKAGFYYGQCRVCVPSGSSESCSAWEPTTTAAVRLTNIDGEPEPETPSELANSVNSSDDLDQSIVPDNGTEGRLSVDSDDEWGNTDSSVQLPIVDDDLNESDVMQIPAGEQAARD